MNELKPRPFAKFAQGDKEIIGVSREMCSLDVQTLNYDISG